MTECKPVISIVVPAKNESASLPNLHNAIKSSLDTLSVPWELILVDDGSTDSTADTWRSLMACDNRLGLVSLVHNFGKEPAILAGLSKANGAAVIPMDADLQDPPELIREFIRHWELGYEMVYGIRKNRDDPYWKRLTSWAFYWFAAKASKTKVPRNTGDFRLLDRKVVNRLLDLPEVDRFTRGLYHLVAGKSIGVEYDRPGRDSGKRTYGFWQSIDQATSFLSFTDLPLRVVAFTGFIFALVGLTYFVLQVIRYAEGTQMAWGWPSLVAIVVSLGGMQLSAMGIIGLYLGRVFREVKRRPMYIIDSCEGSAAGKESR